MRISSIVLAAALAAAVPGCVVEGPHGHVSAGVAVASCDHHFVFYADHSAYHCTRCSHWWASSGGSWVHYRSRPAFIRVTASPLIVRVEERGPRPWVHIDKHIRKARPHGRRDGRHDRRHDGRREHRPGIRGRL